MFLNTGNAFGAVVTDDETPEVTARVARISFIRGDVQVRRGGETEDWERATLNLPLVEGDEIATSKDARVEIQIDSSSHLRLAENAYLKLTTLRDEGVAVSLPQGTMSLRLLGFDKDKTYFEIDAPGTTLSIEKAGLYRVDAGDTTNAEIFMTAGEGGEARVYSQSSGFTLRSGRSVKVFIEGNYAGDYEMNDASRDADEFDGWVLDRDAIIAKRLKDAYYDKYYDRDMYGAEDLSEYGEWIYTRKYGYVWRPFASSVSSYANWSPYRYGHWRWVPVFGWTWVNDEPWGWATYHHGRWIYDNGQWCWTPYAYYRWRRSWWRPALVTITTWNGSLICWYPLPYDSYYYDYNRNYSRYNRRRNNTTIINTTTVVIVNPTPTPSTSPNPSPTPVISENPTNEERRVRARTPPLQRVPPGGVVAVDTSEFGRQTRGYRTLPVSASRTILTRIPDENQTPPILPTFDDLDRKVSREILIENPIDTKKIETEVKTGATRRETGKSLDEELRKKRIFGDRTPILPRNDPEVKPETRKTGAVTRPPIFRPEETDTKQTETPPINPQTNFPPRTTGGGGGKTDNNDERRTERKPVNRPKQQEDNQTPPIFIPPQPEPRQKEERREQPKIPQPRNEEKPRQEQPKQREEPRQQPKPEPKPEPKREEPKPENKPTRPSVIQRKTEKDGR